jgi:NadR type nicotinamide-nucleotide adenylyltransferase
MLNKTLKIAITGPESTGKSTLAEALAEHYGSVWVPEIARQYFEAHPEKAINYIPQDILDIACLQIASEEQALAANPPYLFCDTELLVCKIWYEWKYTICEPWLESAFVERPYDLFVLCDIDMPWEDDPLRENPDPADRQRLFELYRSALEQYQKNFIIVQGSVAERMQEVIKAIEILAPSKDNIAI